MSSFIKAELIAIRRLLKLISSLIKSTTDAARDASETRLVMQLRAIGVLVDDLVQELDERLRVQP